jgi:hypothetical protein
LRVCDPRVDTHGFIAQNSQVQWLAKLLKTILKRFNYNDVMINSIQTIFTLEADIIVILVWYGIIIRYIFNIKQRLHEQGRRGRRCDKEMRDVTNKREQ